jgi:hypothetical protein
MIHHLLRIRQTHSIADYQHSLAARFDFPPYSDSSDYKNVVLDPFCGSGTTVFVAVQDIHRCCRLLQPAFGRTNFLFRSCFHLYDNNHWMSEFITRKAKLIKLNGIRLHRNKRKHH